MHQKRPLGIKAKFDEKNKKEKQEEAPEEQEECLDMSEEAVQLPQGQDEMEDLENIFATALEEIENGTVAAMKWINACIHECDRMMRSEKEYPHSFYRIYGDSLYLLGSVEADANPKLYRKNAEKRAQDFSFILAAIERYEEGLEVRPSEPSLLIGKAKSLVRSAIFDLTTVETLVESALSIFNQSLEFISDVHAKWTETLQFSQLLMDTSETFIKDKKLRLLFGLTSLKLLENETLATMDKEYNLANQLLSLSFSYVDLKEKDQAVVCLEKAKKVASSLKNASDEELGDLARSDILALSGEISLNMGNLLHGSKQNAAYNEAISDIKAAEKFGYIIPEHLTEFVSSIEESQDLEEDCISLEEWSSYSENEE